MRVARVSVRVARVRVSVRLCTTKRASSRRLPLPLPLAPLRKQRGRHGFLSPLLRRLRLLLSGHAVAAVFARDRFEEESEACVPALL